MIADITVASIMGGPDIGLLPHWLAHYRALGLDRFVVAVNDPERATEYDRCLMDNGIIPVCHFDDLYFKDEIGAIDYVNTAITSEWILHADMDEFFLFDRPLEQLLNDCEIHRYRVVRGRFIDHICADGELAAVKDEPSLWRQFPIMHHTTEHVRQGLTTKSMLRHRSRSPTSGNHIPGNDMPSCHPDWQEIHHFRWTAATVPAMRHFLEVWPDCWWRHEYDKALHFLGDPPRLDLDKLRMMASFIELTDTLLGRYPFCG